MPPKFGEAVRILADTPRDALDIAMDMRDIEVARGIPASVMCLEPDVFFVVSGPECIAASEPPEELQDDFEGCDPEDLPYLLEAAMYYVHRQIAALATTLNFRTGDEA